jgi:hypothetical protein
MKTFLTLILTLQFHLLFAQTSGNVLTVTPTSPIAGQNFVVDARIPFGWCAINLVDNNGQLLFDVNVDSQNVIRFYARVLIPSLPCGSPPPPLHLFPHLFKLNGLNLHEGSYTFRYYFLEQNDPIPAIGNEPFLLDEIEFQVIAPTSVDSSSPVSLLLMIVLLFAFAFYFIRTSKISY